MSEADVGALSQMDEEAERVGWLAEEETSRELPDSLEEIVQGAEFLMTCYEQEQLREMLGRHLRTFQKEKGITVKDRLGSTQSRYGGCKAREAEGLKTSGAHEGKS